LEEKGDDDDDDAVAAARGTHEQNNGHTKGNFFLQVVDNVEKLFLLPMHR
jgi:hypothetical protein